MKRWVEKQPANEEEWQQLMGQEPSVADGGYGAPHGWKNKEGCGMKAKEQRIYLEGMAFAAKVAKER